jgi:hypothetical protein
MGGCGARDVVVRWHRVSSMIEAAHPQEHIKHREDRLSNMPPFYITIIEYIDFLS